MSRQLLKWTWHFQDGNVICQYVIVFFFLIWKKISLLSGGPSSSYSAPGYILYINSLTRLDALGDDFLFKSNMVLTLNSTNLPSSRGCWKRIGSTYIVTWYCPSSILLLRYVGIRRYLQGHSRRYQIKNLKNLLVLGNLPASRLEENNSWPRQLR